MKDALNNPSNLKDPSKEIEEDKSKITPRIKNINENKLKNLEARFLGPSSNGNLPYEYDLIQDLNFQFIKSTNSQNENFKNFENENKDKEINYNLDSIKSLKSNKNNDNSARKKCLAIKAEKMTKIVGNKNSVDFLSTKRNRSNNNNTINSDVNNNINTNMNFNSNGSSNLVVESKIDFFNFQGFLNLKFF